ncbi:ComF family protein [Paenibacillus sp. TRM 82003]|nr:ComF family protein [Paenibacillus sp. TRM 82003]MCI3923395.1 ComF family protein [Paenibacillus sp. TRM 82003]
MSWLVWWNRTIAGVEGGLSPRGEACLWCGGRRPAAAVNHRAAMPRLPICERCAADVPWITTIACAACGRAEACADCARRRASCVVANRAAVRYTPFMKEWISRYKYRGDERLAPLFEDMTGFAYEKLRELWTDTDIPTVVSCVPLSDRRLEERGFNQAERMARGLAARYGVTYMPLLVRVRHTEKQSYKSRRERLESLDNAFAANEQAISTFMGGEKERMVRVVLVDDVYTTGSTLQRCAEVLRQAVGADRVEVYGVTWAR